MENENSGNGPLTVEGLQEELKNAKNEIDVFSKSIEEHETKVKDLEIERDSLTEELNELKEKFAKQELELQETKKLNFKLGRTIGADTKSVEQVTQETYSEMFKNIR